MRELICKVACVLSFFTVVGCQVFHTAAKPTPFRHEVVRDQLVLHSDFALPEHHRLIDELIAQRELLVRKLSLVTSEEPIHVYLFADDTAYYDFLDLRFPGFPARRAIFVETDVELSVYAHWGDYVAEDLRHEISHGYLHSAVPNLPLWLDEGLAEYFEVGRGSAGINQAHLKLLKSQTDWQPSLERLEQLSSAAEMTQQDYAEAWAWVHYLLESGGDKANLINDYLADLRQGAAGAALSMRLRQRLAGPELALVEHVRSL